MYIFKNLFLILKLLKRHKLINLILNPKRFIWLLKIKLLNFKIPIKTFPSFEHRNLLKLNPFPDNIIDVGFNKGQFSSLLLLKKKSYIFAFDPSKGESLLIAQKFEKIFPKRFKFYNFALGDKEETKLLNLAISSDNNSFLEPTIENNNLFSETRLTYKKQLSDIKTLSSLNLPLDGFNNLLKIDVQGYELNVLKGISPELYDHIKWIYIELTDLQLYKGQSSRDQINSFLNKMGFFLQKSSNIDLHPTKDKILYFDGLYVNIKKI